MVYPQLFASKNSLDIKFIQVCNWSLPIDIWNETVYKVLKWGFKSRSSIQNNNFNEIFVVQPSVKFRISDEIKNNANKVYIYKLQINWTQNDKQNMKVTDGCNTCLYNNNDYVIHCLSNYLYDILLFN